MRKANFSTPGRGFFGRFNGCLFLLALSALLACPALRAQSAATPAAPIVEAILIRFEGFQNVSTENVRSHIQQSVDAPYDPTLVDSSIRALYQSGYFEFIESRERQLANGNVELQFLIVPKYRIGRLEFEGQQYLDREDLIEESGLKVGDPLDEVQIKQGSIKIFEYLQKKGFPNASVDFAITRSEKEGVAVVTFKVHEGQRMKIDNILFTGNEHISASDLRDQMQTSEYIFLWSWLSGSGRLRADIFETDLEKLRDYFRNHGYLDVKIPESQVQLEYPDPGWLNIVINVEEGRPYFIGDIAISGNELFSEEELKTRALSLRPGDVFSPKAIDDNVQNLRDYYGRLGYLDTNVRLERAPNIATGVIDISFTITEGEKFYVESISLQGNTKTKNDVIVRELALAPGDVFDSVRMRASQARLQNTRYFSQVNLSPEPTNIPNQRKLRISVEEGNTGNLTFGAGFSSVEAVSGFVELSQSNFDLFNYRSGFQGAGQKFRLRLSIGSKSNQILLSFEEPWLYQRQLALGFEVFRTQTDYLSTDYNELRLGFQVYLRRRLFELVEARLSYTLEEVDIRDVSTSAPQVIQDEKGKRSVSKVGLNLSRDDRDNYLWPRSGSRIESITEVAGGPFMGQTNYIKQEFRARVYIPTFDTFEQTLTIAGRTGTIWGYGGKEVPFFDRYFLGGPYTMRGFDYRDVGPIELPSNTAVGGNTMGLIQIDYIFRVLEPLGFKLFYDVGFINSDKFDWNTSGYNDDFGFGLIIILMGSPLNLDFGFPLRTDSYNNKGMRFNFSFGTVF